MPLKLEVDRESLYRHLSQWPDEHMLITAERIASQILPFVHRGIKNHPAHGPDHSIRVIEYINSIADILKSRGLALNQTEIKLLYISGWLHDLGNFYDREQHSIESCKILTTLKDSFQFGNLQQFLEYIIKYHPSDFDLAEVPTTPIDFDGDKIRLPLLCALFRLADACHMGEDRAMRVVLKLLSVEPEWSSGKADAFWKGNEAILSVDLSAKEKKIIILVSDRRAAKIMTDKFSEEFESVRGIIQDYLPFKEVEIREIPKADLAEDYTKNLD